VSELNYFSFVREHRKTEFVNFAKLNVYGCMFEKFILTCKMTPSVCVMLH